MLITNSWVDGEFSVVENIELMRKAFLFLLLFCIKHAFCSLIWASLCLNSDIKNALYANIEIRMLPLVMSVLAV